MLEKIGLPAKPAAKGNTWVIDASSCQGCQAAFTMFNRKHHCRRCGGIFCGSCTSQRAYLRGQGDAPVRICDLCKKLEEAARFQLRNRGKKGSKVGSSAEDDTLIKELLGDEAHAVLSARSESIGEKVDGHDIDLTRSDGIKSGSANVSHSEDGADEHHHGESRFTPEELRNQAIEQKNLYTSLKKEGKNAEALQAYKRSKELGREADALELSLKKMQRKATQDANKKLKESSAGAKDQSHDGTSGGKDASQDSKRLRLSSRDNPDDDLLKTLKDLGWNEADLADEKPKKGPASDMDLLAEISDVLPKDANARKPAKDNPTQLEILAHKRKALALKREGKPAEAKEELKKAKLLEKKLEEMALFGEEDDEEDEDDEELAKLMKEAAKSDLGKGMSAKEPINLSLPSFLLDDDDDHIDVTDDDVHDPSIAAALREMGWEEEAAAMERKPAPSTSGARPSPQERKKLQDEILAMKRSALSLKRSGRIAEAKEELRQAKVLEQRLEKLTAELEAESLPKPITVGSKSGKPTHPPELPVSDDEEEEVEVSPEDLRDPELVAALKSFGWQEEDSFSKAAEERVHPPPSDRKPETPLRQELSNLMPSPRERMRLQDEILAVKRSALALKRSGRIDEAKEELRQAKVLEQRLERLTAELEAEGVPKPITLVGSSKWGKTTQLPALPLSQMGFVSEDEEEDVEVSADDFKDPDLVAALKSVGWQEEDTFVEDIQPMEQEEPDSPPPPPVQPYKPIQYTAKDRQRKLQLQKDLLSHKRRALTLKREGKSEEAKAELKLAKVLEKEMEELENAASGSTQPESDGGLQQKSNHDTSSLPAPIAYEYEEDAEVRDADMHDPEILAALEGVGWKTNAASETSGKLTRPSSSGLPALAGLNENSVSLKNVLDSGRIPEPTPKELGRFDTSKTGSRKYETPPYTKLPVVDTLSDRKSSQPLTSDIRTGGTWSAPSKETIAECDSDEEDLFDADMVAALQSIGLAPPVVGTRKGLKPESAVAKQNDNENSRRMVKNETLPQISDEGGKKSSSSVPILDPKVEKFEAVSSLVTGPSSSGTSDPREEIKMRKRRAVGLKREGKLAEAREELRQAKLLEKQLETETSAAVSDVVELNSTGDQPSAKQQQQQAEAQPPPVSSPATTLTHKQQMQQQVRQGKDRMKLQRETLAHKRKALSLRREGKMEEAEAEFELAKVLEKQMEELDPSKPAHDEGDVGLVEDLLDPQLMAALKGIGWNEADLSRGAGVGKAAPSSSAAQVVVSRPPGSTSSTPQEGKTNMSSQPPSRKAPVIATPSNIVEEKTTSMSQPPMRNTSINQPPVRQPPSVSSAPADACKVQEERRAAGNVSRSSAAARAQEDRRKLEDKIKQEKIRAVELKRAGRTKEAIDALKGAKQMEKQLESLP